MSIPCIIFELISPSQLALGAFLVRESTAKPDAFCLSFQSVPMRALRDLHTIFSYHSSPKGISHAKLLAEQGGFSIKEGYPVFPSIPALVDHYCNHDVTPAMGKLVRVSGKQLQAASIAPTKSPSS